VLNAVLIEQELKRLLKVGKTKNLKPAEDSGDEDDDE
jgi:hypothetical protein